MLRHKKVKPEEPKGETGAKKADSGTKKTESRAKSRKTSGLKWSDRDVKVGVVPVAW